MASNKRLTDLADYTAVLPYASELFGIYQPLLGWRSKRIAERFRHGFSQDKRRALELLRAQFVGLVDVHYGPNCDVRVELAPGSPNRTASRSFDSVVLEKLSELLPRADHQQDDGWEKVINAKAVAEIFERHVEPRYAQFFTEHCNDANAQRQVMMLARAPDTTAQKRMFATAFEAQLGHESSVAGALLFLVEHRRFEELSNIFYGTTNNSARVTQVMRVLNALRAEDGFLDLQHIDPQDKEDLKNVALSPISVVHLFRQYFFELDTFLGPSVSHVWLSPGSTVELLEVQTRRTLVEKSLETFMESVTKLESQTTQQDEISDAVKEDNKRDIKVGAGVTASYASVTATSRFDFGTSQQTAREESHKRMRQQTEKLSTEIRKNFKTMFKTITETVDTSSKRYVLTNTTSELINYELRRKMRQVAVQVQDVGSYLCWQTYVDRPGENLGVAKLMHIAKPAELDSIPPVEDIPMLQPFLEPKVVTVPFVSTHGSDADNEDEVYRTGVEVNDSELLGNRETIKWYFPVECVCSKADYELANVACDGQGAPVSASVGAITHVDNKAQFTLYLDAVAFQGRDSVDVGLTLQWAPRPNANDEIVKKNKENRLAHKAAEQAAHEKAYVENAKERIEQMHDIETRPSEDLREEERIVIYRKLIQDMLMKGISTPDDRTRHVVAELINSIFDVKKMLYFVAPEWWRPQIRDIVQQLEEDDLTSRKKSGDAATRGVRKKAHDAQRGSSAKLSPSTIGWGGVADSRRDNYFITNESKPARFGSSLGWLLQLDGDHMRNAFLNAPWVKAVIPIRPGKEQAAINWLKGVEGFDGIGNDDIYRTNNPNEKDIHGHPLDGQKLIDVLMDLAKKIEKKHDEAIQTGQYPRQDEIADPALVDEDNVVTSTPVDRVYEHGFYPLQGGFRANVTGNYEIFDQWLEILPTDQVVPVEVKYDPKTGRQV